MPLALANPEFLPELDDFLRREGYEARQRQYCRVTGCWCGSTRLLPVPGGNSKYDDYQLCSDCGCLVLKYVLPEHALAELYGLRYFREHQVSIGLPAFSQRFENDARDRIPVWIRLLRRVSTGKRIVEVGCSHGRFLKELADRGYEVVGLELDAEIVAWAKAKTGLDIRCQRIESIPSASFDVFFANDVLEHVYAPRAFAAEALRVVVPGGKALFQTVVFDDWRKCPVGMLRPLYHTILYHASSLRGLLPPGCALGVVHAGPFGCSIIELQNPAAGIDPMADR